MISVLASLKSPRRAANRSPGLFPEALATRLIRHLHPLTYMAAGLNQLPSLILLATSPVATVTVATRLFYRQRALGYLLEQIRSQCT